MNTLIHAPITNDFQLNCLSNNNVFGCKLSSGPKEFCISTNGLSPNDEYSSSEGAISEEYSRNGLQAIDESSSSEAESFNNDHSDNMLKYINQMLMEEEDLEDKPCMLHDCLALQATERSLYEALNDNNSDENSPSDGSFAETLSSNSLTGSQGDFGFLNSSPQIKNSSDFPLIGDDAYYRQEVSSTGPFRVSNLSIEAQKFTASEGRINHFLDNSRIKKNRYREDDDFTEDHRSNKQLASNDYNVAETEHSEMYYDNVLLCSQSDRLMMLARDKSKKQPHQHVQSKGSNRGRPKGGNKKKQDSVVKEVVDLRNLLMQCAQAMASYDRTTTNDLLARIRHHSSPQGDSTERLAHYFARALEARLAGTGASSYAVFPTGRVSAAGILKAYQTYLTASPFRKMSNLLANQTVKKLAVGATTLHIVDFGILYGFQWPCLIQALSERPGGPPKLRITGIDFPQSGFRPEERVADTGRRLARYCERFGIPFEYIAVAKKWEDIGTEDLGIERRGELVVVNSVYRLENVPDETVATNSPRDVVLNLIRQINPDLFIQGVVNGTYNTPFFATRFREAMFHFSSLFDMFEATVLKEDMKNRQLFEEEVWGKDIVNIIACEGMERVYRPETYKQWQIRNVRAGLRQVPLEEDIVRYVKGKVKAQYHKDFSVDEDGKWMLHGWKGRVLHAMSCWQVVE